MNTPDREVQYTNFLNGILIISGYVPIDEIRELFDWHTKDKEQALREFAEKLKKHLGLETHLEYVMAMKASTIDDCLREMIGGEPTSLTKRNEHT